MKKLLAVVLAMLMLCSVGCTSSGGGGGGSDRPYTLNLGLFNGALDRQMMDEIIKDFEDAYPEVHVEVKLGKSEYSDGTLTAQMRTSGVDIYYLDTNTYSTFYQGGYLEDITAEVREKIFDDDVNLVQAGQTATKSIEDTMWSDFKDIYCVNDKYYAIPHYTSIPGIVYDADLFEEMDYEVPETYPEFIELMETMVSDGYTPFCFSTMDYITLASLESFVAMYEGKNDYNIRGTFNGTHSQLGKEINIQNAYLLNSAEGKKAAIQFAYDLARNDTFVTQGTRNGLTHIEAQKQFVSSIMQKPTSSNPRPRVAMFLENSYWEREVKATFDDMSAFKDSYGYGKRNFKYMPAPKMIGVEGIANTTNTDKDTVYVGSTASFVCINATSENKQIAKDFLQFAQSRESLAKYVIHSSSLRAYDFELTDAEIAQCTPYGLSIYNLLSDPNTELVCGGARNPVSIQNGSEFDYNFKYYTSALTSDGAGNKATKVEGRAIFNLMREYPNLTVKQYYDGYVNYWNADRWADTLSKITL